MACTLDAAKKSSVTEGGSGIIGQPLRPTPKPRWDDEPLDTEIAWSKGYLMGLRINQLGEPEHLPDGSWRIPLSSDPETAFVIVQQHPEIERFVAVLFSADGQRVARMTADGDDRDQAVENLCRIAAYEDSALFNVAMDRVHRQTLAIREETRRRNITAAAEAIQMGSGENGKQVIDNKIKEGCTRLYSYKVNNGVRKWVLQNPDQPGMALMLNQKALVDYARLVLAGRGTPGLAVEEYLLDTAAIYPESFDHDAVERALLMGKSVPPKLVSRYPDLVERFGIPT